MTNTLRGEVAFLLDGRMEKLVLTLGALAALEEELGEGGLPALGERLMSGNITVADGLKVLAAGLRGAGKDLSSRELGQRIPADRLDDTMLAAARLLAAALGGGNSSRPPPPQAGP